MNHAVMSEEREEPNHNWCAGCSPDNCSGCGAGPAESEQVESGPVAWCLAYDDPNLKLRIHSNPTMCEAEIDAHVKGLNGALSKAPLYTTPQPDRTAELEQLRTRIAELEALLKEAYSDLTKYCVLELASLRSSATN